MKIETADVASAENVSQSPEFHWFGENRLLICAYVILVSAWWIPVADIAIRPQLLETYIFGSREEPQPEGAAPSHVTVSEAITYYDPYTSGMILPIWRISSTIAAVSLFITNWTCFQNTRWKERPLYLGDITWIAGLFVLWLVLPFLRMVYLMIEGNFRV